jgi:hypothetical protein
MMSESKRHLTRRGFVTAAALLPLAAEVPRSIALASARGVPPDRGGGHRHDFLNQLKDDGSERLWHGYPDECFSFTSFADSLVAHVMYGGWSVQPPVTIVRMALVVDFISAREDEAEASLPHGWGECWEFPMGVTSTRHSTPVNVQNERNQRHLTLIGTAMTRDDFHRAISEKLLDVQSCPDKLSCELCQERAPRGLGDVFSILAEGTAQSEVHLFSRWMPSENLANSLAADGIRIVAHPLSAIPTADLKANKHYHIWDGSEDQAHEFRSVVWAPAWKHLEK